MSDQDSIMMIVKDVTIEDPSPYQEYYEEKIANIGNEAEKILKDIEIAKFYTSTPDLSKNYGSGQFGYVSSIIGEMKGRERIDTPRQHAFIEMMIKQMREDGNEKGAKDTEKKLKKGKISKSVKPEIHKYLQATLKQAKKYEQTIDTLEARRKRMGVINCVKKTFPSANIEPKFITIKDTIINKSWRPYIYVYGDKFKKDDPYGDDEDIVKLISDKKKISEDWNWLKTDERVFKNESYPADVDYYVYKLHPEYKVISYTGWDAPEFAVYDTNGKLVAIPDFKEEMLSIRHIDKLKKLVYQYAFKNNYKGIQSTTPHTIHYVKVQSGMEKLTAKEERASNQASTRMANALLSTMKASAKYGKNSRQAREASRKGAAQFFGALSGSSFYDDAGYRWLDQVESSFGDRILSPYKLERLNDNTFRLLYVDSDGSGEFEIITRYSSGQKPYTYTVNYQINSLAKKKFFSKEELENYEKLINRRNQ